MTSRLATQGAPRDNVILELGYFVGRLNRSRVCALKRGDIEVPSDIVGVVFEPFDDAGGWKLVIARELEEAGYISCQKSFAGRVPKTQYKLSVAGRRALERYLDHMEALIRAMREK